MNILGWVKTIADGGKLVADMVRAFLPKRSKPGPDVKPIGPDDLRKKP